MDTSKIFTLSENHDPEYICKVHKIGQLYPIEKSINLVKTMVDGEWIVVRKDIVHEGDIFFYVAKENVIHADFLRKNNLYMYDKKEMNDNYEDVLKAEKKALQETDPEKQKLMMMDVKSMCGFFAEKGRVRMVTLCGEPSFGYIFGLEELRRWKPELNDVDINMESLVGTYFDTVCGTLFNHVYVPKIPETSMAKRSSHEKKREKRLKKFNRIIDTEFAFHYDTPRLGQCIANVKPDDMVVLSVKLHGTSAIFGNIKVRHPKKLPIHKKIFNKIIDVLPQSFGKYRICDFYVDYGDVCSSRSVIKNQHINPNLKEGWYKVNVWDEYNKILRDFIPQGMIIYGEIVGYEWGRKDKMIQRQYDYGCQPGENQLMIYRITTALDNGEKYEWNVEEIREWTIKFMEDHPEIAHKIHPIDILYHGTLRQLYPDVDINCHWNENVLIKLKEDKDLLGMELLEPMCKNKVPREGIVLRIDNSPIKAMKLKTEAYAKKEAKDVDKGLVDMEMSEHDYQDSFEQ